MVGSSPGVTVDAASGWLVCGRSFAGIMPQLGIDLASAKQAAVLTDHDSVVACPADVRALPCVAARGLLHTHRRRRSTVELFRPGCPGGHGGHGLGADRT